MTSARPVSVLGFGSYLPGEAVPATYFLTEAELSGPIASNPLFKVPTTRHHVARDERAAQMIVAAAEPMFERLGIAPRGNVDVLLTNVMLPDHPITGHGAETAELLGCSPEWIIDLHNGGCGSIAYMMKLANALISTGQARTALLCNAQNGAGQLFTQPKFKKNPYAAVAGDGCGVVYLAEGDSAPVLGTAVTHNPQFARDLSISGGSRKYWEPGPEEVMVSFDKQKLGEIIERGNRLVPEVVTDLCKQIGVPTADIDILITNQPNKMFLRNWREALDVPAERHLDTYDELGNLYTAGASITAERAIAAGRIAPGDLVVLAGFAHAGDLAGAAAFRWQP